MNVGYELLGIPGRGFLEGQGQYAFRLLRAMLAEDTPHRFTLFFNSFRKPLSHDEVAEALGRDDFTWEQTRIPGCDVSPLTIAAKYKFWTARAKSLGVDLFHGTSFRGLAPGVAPSVVTVHDLMGAFFPQTVRRDRNVDKLRREVDRARRVIAPSDRTRRDLLMLWGVDDDKVTVIPEGYNGPTTPAGDPPPGLPGRFVLYVGSYRRNKNVPRLVDAFARIADRLPDVHLALVGEPGGYRDGLVERIRRRRLDGRVHITGFLDDPQLEAVYARALCLVQPSVYEGFGLTPLEAMGRGVPVAVADNTSMPEVVGDAGLTFDPLSVEEIAGAVLRLVTVERLRVDLSPLRTVYATDR